MTLYRHTALARGKGPERRTRLRPFSAKTVAARPEHDRVRAEVFERDGWTCRVKGRGYAIPCFGPPTVHHLRKSSGGGAYTLANLICLCAHHNEAVERFPDWSEEVGLAERGLQIPQETWRKLFLARLAASPEVGSGPWIP